MANALALDHENDHLGDVGGVVGDPLKIFRDGRYLHCPVNGQWIRDHKAYGFAENLTIEIIHFLVIFANLEGQIRVLPHEGV